jgi:hypothetical protein
MTTEGWDFDGRDHPAFFVPVLRWHAGLCKYRLRSLLFSLGYVPARQRLGTMNDMQILIEQMVSDISSQAVRLDEVRLQKFLEWLKSHSSKVKTEDQGCVEVAIHGEGSIDDRLKNGLKNWFESLPMQGLLWEYHLLLDEITWWRDLDPRTLARILRSEGNE